MTARAKAANASRGAAKRTGAKKGARGADLRVELPRLLGKARRPGEFCASGAAELPIVKIAVKGVGPLGLPITPAQAEALVKAAKPAPYGRGAKTIVDPAVRRCWQLPPRAVELRDPRWQAVLDEVTRQALAGLGVSGAAKAELYKLLVYDEGSFFLEHRDTEKSPGMFGTLVVVLPSAHRGGELIVRHAGREATLDLAGEDLGVVRWGAFYADCLHELRPVRRGYRVALVYNLVRRAGRAPTPPDHGPVVRRVAEALRRWPEGPQAPVKLVVPLAHQYTPAELAFATLKNEDAAAAAVLSAACVEAGCVLRLGMISIHQAGAAEPLWDSWSGRGWGRRRWYDDDEDDDDVPDYEVIELDMHERVVDDWRTPDDRVEKRGPIDFEDEELAPPGALDDETPDEEHFHEATGNEGCSFERTYRRAALVLWPAAHELRVLHQGGPEVAIAAVKRLARSAKTRSEAEALARIVVEEWPRPAVYEGGGISPRDATSDRGELLEALTRLRDRALLEQFLREVVAAGAFDGDETEALVRALRRVSVEVAGGVLEGLVERLASRRFPPLARLLRAVAKDRPGAYLVPPLEALVQAIARAQPYDRLPWGHEVPTSRAAALVDLLHALGAVPGCAAAGDRLIDELRGARERWPLDEVLLPAARAVHRRRGPLASAVSALRADVLAHLRARVARRLAPPKDAARSSEGLRCVCADCRALAAFLADRTGTTWVLKAAKDRRQHLTHQALQAKLDVKLRTEQRGRPYSLVCTKTQASYEARVTQRKEDLAALAALE